MPPMSKFYQDDFIFDKHPSLGTEFRQCSIGFDKPIPPMSKFYKVNLDFERHPPSTANPPSSRSRELGMTSQSLPSGLVSVSGSGIALISGSSFDTQSRFSTDFQLERVDLSDKEASPRSTSCCFGSSKSIAPPPQLSKPRVIDEFLRSPPSKRANNSWTSVLYNFTQETTIHGLAFITRPARFTVRRYYTNAHSHVSG